MPNNQTPLSGAVLDIFGRRDPYDEYDPWNGAMFFIHKITKHHEWALHQCFSSFNAGDRAIQVAKQHLEAERIIRECPAPVYKFSDNDCPLC